MLATGLIDRPPDDPHQLIGSHWYEIDPTSLTTVAVRLALQSMAASTAEQKTHNDVNAYELALPEGFEAQIAAGRRVANMAGELSKWLTPAATEIQATAVAVAAAKVATITAVRVANALIAAKRAEIAILTPMAAGVGPHASQAQIRINALQREIDDIISSARSSIASLYENVPQPVLPPALGLTPVVHTGPPANGGKTPHIQTVSNEGQGAGRGASALDNKTGGTEPGQEPRQWTTERGSGATDPAQHAGDPTPKTEPAQFGGARPSTGGAETAPRPSGGIQPPAPRTPPVDGVPGATGLPSTGATPEMGIGGLSAPGTPSAGGLGTGGLSSGGLGSSGLGSSGLGSSGLGSSSGLSGLTSNTGASATQMTPTQQFLSGVQQGLAQSPMAASSASAASGAPFRPPESSTMQSTPISHSAPAAPAATPTAGQQVQVAPSPAAAPQAPAGAGIPMAAPAPAGVPNAPPPASAGMPTPPPAMGGGGGGTPVSPASPSLMNLGKKSAAAKAARMGSHSFGETVTNTAEYGAALALVAALNDPQRPGSGLLLGGWSCAVYGAGESAQFVIAERHGLSWIPAGVYLPAEVTVAHLDPRVPADERFTWRGMDPSALVLSRYAKAIGEQPRIVVARAWHSGMPGWFAKGVVLAADEADHVIVPNPLLDPSGRHRLEVAAPGEAQWVRSVPDDQLSNEIHSIAGWLVERHNQYFDDAVDAELRSTALAQFGRSGSAEPVAAEVFARMRDIAPRLIGCPEYGTKHWQLHTETEMQLRGWEVLLLGLRGVPSRTKLMDMRYAALMATQFVLPPAE